MKKMIIGIVLLSLFMLGAEKAAWAGEIDVLVNRLVQKGILTPAEAQIVVDETKIQVSKDLAQGKSLSVPEWTQRIKWGGDIRYRTQGDWGKGNSPQNTATPPSIQEQRLRNRIRGRFYMEGKVNDFTYGGVRLAGGSSGARSTNDTVGGGAATTSYFQKYPVMFDQYYMRFEAPSDIVREYGQYFSDMKLWAGRFNIPFEYSELVWDSDINPGGVAFQYVSPDIKTKYTPDTNIYGNFGMFWLDELGNINTDPILFGFQVGAKTDTFGPLGTILNVSTAFYNFSNMKDKTSVGSANTNTRWWAGDDVTYNRGAYRYGYNVFDLLVNIDNTKIMDFDFPHGFYGDFIYNPEAPNENKGALVGAYIGKKKLKVPGDWKARAEWRYIERDSVPDFMPDSDFYGFGTWATTTNVALNNGNNGIPAEGGTNGKGINIAAECQILKNTVLSLEYYWMKPIKSWDKTQPWNEFQCDVITKF